MSDEEYPVRRFAQLCSENAQLRELNAELLYVAMRLAALEHRDGGRTYPNPFDCAEARRVIAKGEKLK